MKRDKKTEKEGPTRNLWTNRESKVDSRCSTQQRLTPIDSDTLEEEHRRKANGSTRAIRSDLRQWRTASTHVDVPSKAAGGDSRCSSGSVGSAVQVLLAISRHHSCRRKTPNLEIVRCADAIVVGESTE